MSDQLKMFEDQNSLESMESPSEALAKTSVLQAIEKVCQDKGQALSLKQLGLSKNADLVFCVEKC